MLAALVAAPWPLGGAGDPARYALAAVVLFAAAVSAASDSDDARITLRLGGASHSARPGAGCRRSPARGRLARDARRADRAGGLCGRARVLVRARPGSARGRPRVLRGARGHLGPGGVRGRAVEPRAWPRVRPCLGRRHRAVRLVREPQPLRGPDRDGSRARGRPGGEPHPAGRTQPGRHRARRPDAPAGARAPGERQPRRRPGARCRLHAARGRPARDHPRRAPSARVDAVRRPLHRGGGSARDRASRDPRTPGERLLREDRRARPATASRRRVPRSASSRPTLLSGPGWAPMRTRSPPGSARTARCA